MLFRSGQNDGLKRKLIPRLKKATAGSKCWAVLFLKVPCAAMPLMGVTAIGTQGWCRMAVPLMAAAAAVSVASAVTTAKAQKNQAGAQAKAAEYNAGVAAQDAENAGLIASANEDEQRRKSAIALGAQRAALTEGGIDVSSGTGADLMEQSGLNAELDALNIRYQGKLQQRGFNTQAVMSTLEKNNARYAQRQAFIGGVMGAASAGLSGAAQTSYMARTPSTTPIAKGVS